MVQDKKIQEAALLGEETTLLTILIDYRKRSSCACKTKTRSLAATYKRKTKKS